MIKSQIMHEKHKQKLPPNITETDDVNRWEEKNSHPERKEHSMEGHVKCWEKKKQN